MILNSLPNNAANAIAAFLPSGQKPLGLDASYARISTVKPIEPLVSSERLNLRARDPVDRDANSENLNVRAPFRAQEGGESARREAFEQRQEEEAQIQSERERRQLLEDQRVITQLASRDREVRAHEQAHSSVGGQYAGAPTYQFERGPDGVNYAVSGEVSIDVSKEATPEETLRKAQIVRRAALAPADPSPQDRRVAAQATQMEAESRSEIAANRAEEAREKEEANEARREQQSEAPNGIDSATLASESVSLSSTESPSIREQVTAESQLYFSTANVNQLNQVISSTAINPNRPGTIVSQFV